MSEQIPLKLFGRQEMEGWWVLTDADGNHLSLGAETSFPEREDLVQALQQRGLTLNDAHQVVRVEISEPVEVSDGETPTDTEKPAYSDADNEREASRYSTLSDVQKKAYLAQSRVWKKENPDKVLEYRQRWKETKRERYNNDPEYRERVRAYNREYRKRKKEGQASDGSK